MDFFERQDQARRNTKLLVVYFVLGVAMLIVAVYAAAAGDLCRPRLAAITMVTASRRNWCSWNPQLFLGAAVGTLAVIALGSGFKTLELAQGGSAVATMLGGRLVDPDHDRPGRAQAAERGRGNGHRRGRAGAAGLSACPRSGASTPLPPATRRATPWSPSPPAPEAAHARRTARRHRPRVQPHPQRRHAAQPAPDGHHLRHPLPGGHWPGPPLHPQPQQQRQEPAAAAGAGADRDWLGRRLLRPAHPGGRQPAARVPGRRLVGAVHAQPGGPGRRAEEDRRPELRLEARGGARRGSQPHVLRQRHGRVVLPPDGHASAAGGAHPRHRPELRRQLPARERRRGGTSGAAGCAAAAVAPAVPVPRHAARARGPGRAGAAGHCRADRDGQHGQSHPRPSALRRGFAGQPSRPACKPPRAKGSAPARWFMRCC